MSYVLELVRLPPGDDPEAAYRARARTVEAELARTGGDPGPIDPQKERAKQRLARALVARHPSLRVFEPDFAALARENDVDLEEAKRRFRDVELNEPRYSIQILLFDDAAGASLSLAGTPEECAQAVRFLWDCLGVLRSEAGFQAFDPQADTLLDLDADLDLVLRTACGRRF